MSLYLAHTSKNPIKRFIDIIFNGNIFILTRTRLRIMASILEQLIWPLHRRPRMGPKALFEIDLDRKARELETAKEILQEVFATSLAEVDEMIRLRLEDRGLL
jgi:hypothetical protein